MIGNRYIDLREYRRSQRHLVYRALHMPDRQPVVIKTLADESPSANAIAHLQHEYEILADLTVPGVPRILAFEMLDGKPALILTDAGDTTLLDLINSQPIELRAFLELAIQIAEVLERLHEANLVHRNICASNIAVDSRTGSITLLDFALATDLTRTEPSLVNLKALEGALGYIAPEQTGRMNRSVDHRSDLYSLGITYYEMLTGRLPFFGQDPVELVHCHVAKTPQPPHAVAPAVPLAVSQLVIKLLSKSPEDRYQSTVGLVSDLRECHRQLLTNGSIEPFQLGRQDKRRHFEIWEKLYGREQEVAALEAAFARVSDGSSELVVITGEPGIGKSSLVSEVYKPLTERRAYFASGKFDQLQRAEPFSALIQAFRALVRDILRESDERLLLWKERIREAVGTTGAVLTSIIPEVSLIIGDQPPLATVSSLEARNRFNLCFQNFARALASAEHPLVLFLDDLQWADVASLKVIELLADPEMQHTLILGAYRDNELGHDHPLFETLKQITNNGNPVKRIHLTPLALGNISELCSDSLDCSVSKTASISEFLLARTDGNPYFVKRLLTALNEDGLISFDQQLGTWSWRLEDFERVRIADNVAEFMARTIEKLPSDTQLVLKLAACIGNQFTLEHLCYAHDQNPTVTASCIWPALQRGLLVPRSDGELIPRRETAHLQADCLSATYQFTHDRVQQAAYSLLADDQRVATHHRLGRLLHATLSVEELQEQLFAVVDHLNFGRALIASDDDLTDLCRLNLEAGLRAKNCGAIEQSLIYLQTGVNSLPDACWTVHRDLAFALYRQAAESAILSGELELFEQLFDVCLERAVSPLEMADLCEMRSSHLAQLDRSKEAVQWAMKGLSYLDSPSTVSPELCAESELEELSTRLAGRDLQDVLNLPEMRDEADITRMKLLFCLGLGAFQDSQVAIWSFAAARMVNLSLQHGNTPLSALGYVSYGVYLCTQRQFALGYEFGKLALEVCERYSEHVHLCMTLCWFCTCLNHWGAHVKTSLKYYREAIDGGMQSGGVGWAATAISMRSPVSFACGFPISDLIAEVESGLALTEKLKYEHDVQHLLPYRQALRCLKTTTFAAGSFDDEQFNEEVFLGSCVCKPISVQYRTLRLQTCYLLGDFIKANDYAEATKPTLETAIGFISTFEFNLYHSLTLLALATEDSGEARSSYLREVRANQEQLARWAGYCPDNFRHKHALVEAEIARLTAGDMETTLALYDEAIQAANEQGFLQDEALANELAGAYLKAKGKPRLAISYLKQGLNLFRRWGADAKVAAMETTYPELKGVTALDKAEVSTSATTLDLMAVLKAGQAIGQEVELESLLVVLMQTVIEAAGAERAVLILQTDGGLTVRAHGGTGNQNKFTLEDCHLDEFADAAKTIINYVRRTQDLVVLGDALEEKGFASDPYIQDHAIRSVLCLPMVKKSKLVGIVYLENNLAPHVFTAERIDLLTLLSSEIAISLENGVLLNGLQQEILERKRAQSALQNLNEQLEQLIHLRTAELERVNHELSRSNAELQQFAYVASHDLQEPLRAVKGYLDLFYRRYGTAVSGEARTLLDSAADGATRMQSLIHDLLEYARVDSRGKEFTRVDCTVVLKQALSNLSVAIDECHADITHENLPLVNADESQLIQLFQNLIGNAIKFRRDDAPRVHLSAARDCQNWRISVRDNGIGIDMAHAEKLFTIFKRLHTRMAYAGTGIGLAVCKKIVERHGGTIWVESEPGAGSDFIFTIPVMDPDAESK